MAKTRLYRTTIVIYTDYDASRKELEELALAATAGDAICDEQTCEEVALNDAPEGVLSFYNLLDDDDEA